MTQRPLLVKIAVHVVGWLGFLALPVLFLPRPYLRRLPPTDGQATGSGCAWSSPELWQMATPPHSTGIMLGVLLIHATLIGFYYLNAHVLIPKLLAARKVKRYALAVLSMLGLVLALTQIPMHFARVHADSFPVPLIVQAQFGRLGALLLFAIIFIVSSGSTIIADWQRTKQRNEQAQAEQSRTELALLKAQINPHFLFNTLNNLYVLALKKSDHTAPALLTLSQMMRYVLQEAAGDFVSLGKELQYIQDFIGLHRLRLTAFTKLEVAVDCPEPERLIAPMLLVPFVENAFKYGVSTQTASRIEIEIRQASGMLHVRVFNQKMTSHPDSSTHIGLANTQRRLELLYPDAHRLHIEDNPEGFEVRLEVDLARPIAQVTR